VWLATGEATCAKDLTAWRSWCRRACRPVRRTTPARSVEQRQYRGDDRKRWSIDRFLRDVRIHRHFERLLSSRRAVLREPHPPERGSLGAALLQRTQPDRAAHKREFGRAAHEAAAEPRDGLFART
jgi:hypothetical protein